MDSSAQELQLEYEVFLGMLHIKNMVLLCKYFSSKSTRGGCSKENSACIQTSETLGAGGGHGITQVSNPKLDAADGAPSYDFHTAQGVGVAPSFLKEILASMPVHCNWREKYAVLEAH